MSSMPHCRKMTKHMYGLLILSCFLVIIVLESVSIDHASVSPPAKNEDYAMPSQLIIIPPSSMKNAEPRYPTVNMMNSAWFVEECLSLDIENLNLENEASNPQFGFTLRRCIIALPAPKILFNFLMKKVLKKEEDNVIVARIGPYFVNFTIPMNWNVEFVQDRSWRLWFSGLRDLISPAVDHYYTTGSVVELILTKKLVLDWCHQFSHTAPSPNMKSDLFIKQNVWYDMSVANRIRSIIPLVQALAFANDTKVASTEELISLLQCLQKHGAHATKDKYRAKNNHGLFTDVSLYFLANTFPFLSADTDLWKKTASKRFAATLRETMIVDEGFHLEHSPAYQYDIYRLIKIADDIKLIEATDLSIDILEKMVEVLGWMITTDREDMQDKRTLIAIGDTTPTAGSAVISTSDVSILTPVFGFKVFKNAGYVYKKVQATQSQLVFVSAFHSQSHKHEDELSVVLNEFGRKILVDPGKHSYAYGHPDRQYALSMRSHNRVVVSGKTDLGVCFDNDVFLCEKQHFYGSGIIFAKEIHEFSVMTGWNPLYTPLNVDHRRLVIYKPGEMILIIDKLINTRNEKLKYERFFHFSDKAVVAAKFFENKDHAECNIFTTVETNGTLSNDLLPLIHFQDWTSNEFRGLVSVVKGQTEPVHAGWIYPKYFEAVAAPVVSFFVESDSNPIFATAIAMHNPTSKHTVKLKMHRPITQSSTTGDLTMAFQLEDRFWELKTDKHFKEVIITELFV